MPDLSQRWSSYAYALMRIVVGLLFLCHGLSKLVHFPVPPPGQMPLLLTYTAGPIELVCGTLVALGLFTRWAAFIASGEMAVAYFIVHFPRGPLPIANGGEPAVLWGTRGALLFRVPVHFRLRRRQLERRRTSAEAPSLIPQSATDELLTRHQRHSAWRLRPQSTLL